MRGIAKALPFHQLVEAAPDGMIVCDRQGVIALVNAQIERMFGYTREELVGERVDLLVPEAVRPRHDQHLASYSAAPRLRPMGSGLDLFGRRKDGSELPIEISLSPIEVDGELFVTAGIRDVTERRRLQHELRRAHGYLTSAVEASQDAFALFDDDDRVVLANSAARKLFASDAAASLVGKPFEQLLSTALEAGVFDLNHETRDGLLARWTAYHRSAAGALEVRTRTGRYLRVTERKTADHATVLAIADITDDVQRAAELGRARELAEAASAAKSEFLSSMSHELRTPLNAILGFAQLLERGTLEDRQRERLGHVLRGGEHLLRLIDDILDLSRIEAGRIAVESEVVEVRALLAQIGTTLEPMAAHAHIELSAPVLPPALSVFADRTRLAQILMNFGSNAIKYGKQGGHVSFQVETSGEMVRIAVVDDGIGIPDDKRDRIFEPFQRAGQETGPIEGTGIGLTISKRLAELMRGSIGFTSEVGRGSVFWIELPLHGQAAPELPAGDVPAHAVRAAQPAQQKVVYVEDNPSNIAFMRDLFADLPSLQLLTAPTGEIGIHLIRSELPALVIMDINLPGMNGFEAVKRLREWPETRDIKVVGLSAAAFFKDTARAKEAGFYRYLTKPVKVAELAAVLQELIAP